MVFTSLGRENGTGLEFVSQLNEQHFNWILFSFEVNLNNPNQNTVKSICGRTKVSSP